MSTGKLKKDSALLTRSRPEQLFGLLLLTSCRKFFRLPEIFQDLLRAAAALLRVRA